MVKNCKKIANSKIIFQKKKLGVFADWIGFEEKKSSDSIILVLLVYHSIDFV